MNSTAREALRDAQRVLVKAPLLLDELDQRARFGMRDGYPMGGDGARGGSTATPTEGAALANAQHPAFAAAESIVDDLVFIARVLTEAEDLAASRGVFVDLIDGTPTVRRPAPRKATRADDSMWCRQHLTFGMFEPVSRRGLCRFCEAWDRETEDVETQAIKRLTGALPPRQVLEARTRGRLTATRLAEIRAGLQREASSKTRRRKRARKR